MKPSTTIALTQMWESFSFFGMRTLLVLYLTSAAGFDPGPAVILYTLYIALVKVLGGAGGVIVDRFLGYKQAVITGGIFILLGHLALTFSDFFFLSLGCIVVGSAIFRVSLQTLLGLTQDPKGFTLFYVGMNLGGLLAAVLCGIVAQKYGWHVGFGLAAFGMVLGLFLFILKRHDFDGLAPQKRTAPSVVTIPLGSLAVLGCGYLLYHFAVAYVVALPLGLLAFILIVRQEGSKALLFSLTLLVAFAAVEELWGSLLMLFSEYHVDRMVFGTQIPSSMIAATNPLTIILVGPFLAKFKMNYETKLMLGFLSIALAFSMLYGTALASHPSVLYLILALGFIAVGEVLIVPAIFEFVAKLAPGSSTKMGATILSLAMGALISGKVANIPYGADIIFIGIGSAALALSIFIAALKVDFFEKSLARIKKKIYTD